MAKKDKKKKERTYSPKAVWKELRQVEWPSFKELMKSSGLVIVFTILFGIYFLICELAASGLLSVIVG